MSFERKMKKQGMSKLDEIVPNPYAKPNRFPFWARIAVPVGSVLLATSIALAIALPLSLGGSRKDASALNKVLDLTGVSEIQAEMPYPTFKNVLEGHSSLLRIRSGYDESIEKKIALTLPPKVLNSNTHYKEQGNTLDAWFMYYGGCIREEAMIDAVSAYAFPKAESIPAFINGEEVVGVYYEGYVSILDDVMDDLEIEYPYLMSQYYKVRCSLDGDRISESPEYGFSEALRYREYRVYPHLLNGFRLYQTNAIVSVVEDGMSLSTTSWEDFFDYDSNPSGMDGRSFHIPELQPYLEEASGAIPYDLFKSAALKYRDFYRAEVLFNAEYTVIDAVDPSKRNLETIVYRDYQEYNISPLPGWGLPYDEAYFQSNLLVTFTLAYQGEHGAYWDEIFLTKSYRKGEETYLEVNVTAPKEPVNEYAKTLLIEMPVEDLATLSYDPILLYRFGN